MKTQEAKIKNDVFNILRTTRIEDIQTFVPEKIKHSDKDVYVKNFISDLNTKF